MKKFYWLILIAFLQCFFVNNGFSFYNKFVGLAYTDSEMINNNSKSNKLNDQIFWYKAETRPDFRLGSKEFWEISKNMGSDDEDEAYDPSKSKKKNAGQAINVKKTKWQIHRIIFLVNPQNNIFGKSIE